MFLASLASLPPFVASLPGAFNDWGKDRQFQELNALQEVIEVKVVRGGQQVIVPNTNVVVGDLLLLEAGDKVVADGYMVEVSPCHLLWQLACGQAGCSGCCKAGRGWWPSSAGSLAAPTPTMVSFAVGLAKDLFHLKFLPPHPQAHGCVIDEASLTGESDPVKKGGDHDPWVRSGTQASRCA